MRHTMSQRGQRLSFRPCRHARKKQHAGNPGSANWYFVISIPLEKDERVSSRGGIFVAGPARPTHGAARAAHDASAPPIGRQSAMNREVPMASHKVTH